MDYSIKMNTKTRILVTGATGFIGSNLVKVLIQKGYDVRVLVPEAEKEKVFSHTDIFVGDIADSDSLQNIQKDIRIVIHCAGILGKWGSGESDLYRVNVEGTENLLKQCSFTELDKIIHLSAGGVSGPVAGGMVDETYPCNPATEYEKTKLTGEQRALELAEQLDLPLTVVRPTFTYGPGDPHKTGLFRAVKKGKFAFIGDGMSVNHPVFIDDLINGIFLALEKGKNRQIYIIGGERPVTKKELVHTIADTLGVKRPGIYIPRWIADLAAPLLEMTGRIIGFEPVLTKSRVMMMGDNFGYSIKKAQSELGYNPIVSLKDGIEKTVRYYLEKGLI